ncbi:MAG TPA: GNAT family N-acetyltransferase [Symbiobacteriaceae bacterium]|nr:GNAT family N-acetyltransferase [Symbiobacteriaceae bacterium]
MITYTTSTEGVETEQLAGFFVGWPTPPAPVTHLRLLKNSDHVVLAKDEASGQVVGFITAITDHVLFAYIPLLEVLPDYKGRGIGQELARRMLTELDGIYSVDLLCDEDVQPFYDRTGMFRAVGMTAKNFAAQSGK